MVFADHGNFRLLLKDIGGLSIGDVALEGSCKRACECRVGSDGGRGGGGGGFTKDPYTCERLTQIRGGYRALTHSCVALQFDFNHPEVVSELVFCKLVCYTHTRMHARTHAHTHTHNTHTQIPLPPAATLHLQVIAAGQVDALVAWFDLHLDPSTSFSTAPSWDISWDQAVFPVGRDLTVQVGDTIVVNAVCSDVLLEMRFVRVLHGQVCSNGLSAADGEERMQQNGDATVSDSDPADGEELMQQNGDATVSDYDPSVSGHLPSGKSVFYVDRSALLRLNDSLYMESYRRALCLAVAETARADASSNSSSDSELELECGMLSMALGNGSCPVPASLPSGDEQARSSRGDLEPQNGSMESAQPDPASGSDFADCIVLDVAHGLSVFGLLAARCGMEHRNGIMGT